MLCTGGSLPADFKNFVSNPDPSWRQGSEVVIKVGKSESVQENLRYEADFSSKISLYDKHNIFLRYYYDSAHKVLLSAYEEDLTSMDQWVLSQKSGLSMKTIDRISGQLYESLKVLRDADLVHSDFGFKNILINPKTLQVKIIDYGVMARRGEYNPGRRNTIFNRRGGRIKSNNQNSDALAQFEDDEFAVQVIVADLKRRKNSLVYEGARDLRPPSENEITALAPDSQEWIHLTTRNGKISDKHYPRRLYDSMKLIFEPYVDQFLQGQNPDFIKMLRLQHQVLAVGLDGDDLYFGASSGYWNKLLRNSAVPERFRNEAFNGPSIFRWRLTISISDQLDGDTPNVRKNPTIPVELQGIPPEFWGTRTIADNTVRFVYPKLNSVPVYLEGMQESLSAALTLIKQGESKEKILPHLADYLQRGLTGHIFSVGNFSLYMTQVNGILRRLGYAGVPPANLDYHAIVEDSDVFRRRFVNLVLKD